MSGICGIVNFDGALVDPALLRQMAEAAAYRGPDGITYWIEGNVGLAYLALHTTPESVREKQPLPSQRRGLILVADARVDNRDELIRTLTAKDYLEEQDPTDADLILAAYECWGEACAREIIGDFAFAVWDKRERRLLAAVDQRGARPFYYRFAAGTLQWASEAVQLLADPRFPAALDDLMIARDLALPGYYGRHESYYQGIAKVGQAEQLSGDAQGVRIQQYWDFDPEYKIHYTNDDEYVEHFRVLFQQAVRDRLRSVRPIVLFMSGGLDSTSVAAIAASELAHSSEGLTSEFQTISWKFDLTPRANEYEYSRAVAERSHLHYHEVLADSLPSLFEAPTQMLHRDEPYASPWHALFVGSLRQLNLHPAVIMTGCDGDSLVGVNNPFYYLHQIKRGQFATFIREFTSHRRMYGLPYRMALTSFLLSPLLLQPIKTRLRSLAHRTKLPAWISPDLIKRTKLVEWVQEQLDQGGLQTKAPKWDDPARAWRYHWIMDRRTLRARIWYDRMAASAGAEVWNPWDDVRLAAYILAIPQEYMARGINHKLILRQTMQDSLPEVVRERRGLRAGPEVFTREHFRCKDAQIVENMLRSGLESSRLGYINTAGLESAIGDLHDRPSNLSMSFWLVLSLELWLRVHNSDK